MNNYPPGHPTGISVGDEQDVFLCDPCNALIIPDESLKLRLQLKHGRIPSCPYCGETLPRATCDCGAIATRIDCDRAVNYHQAYCSVHGLGVRR